MRIAFDGTVLNGRKSGVGYYCEELLKAILSIDHENEFFVFSHRPMSLNAAPCNGNLRFVDSGFFPVRAFYMHTLLPRILKTARPSLCHYTNFLAPIVTQHPYVVTIHDMGLETLSHAHPISKRVYTKRLTRHVAPKARLIITNSEYSKWEIIRHLGIPEFKIRVTPLAASRDFMPVKVQASNPYFLYVGNLEPRKNLERLLEAFARLPAKTHDLVIAGNRWYRGGDAEEKARALGLNGRVKFLGYVARADLPALFSGAVAFVYPSLLEGFGLPVLEAMACGAPVVTSNSSSLKEVAGDAAFLVDPLDVREMTEAMMQIAEDPGLRETLSRKGLQRASEFSWETTARLTLDAYRDAAQPSPPGRGRREAPGEGIIHAAIQKTIAYAQLFQYPLTPVELHERLFDVEVDKAAFDALLERIKYQPDPELVTLRAAREAISDAAIRAVHPHLRTLASIPFVRMVAFSGSTAHRNMLTTEDLDLFIIVEDGKLWAVFLIAMVWSKLKGLRKHLCMNYLISDAALPLFEHDAFTAQQAASLKPVFGKTVYDRFIEANPFVRRHFPNFDKSRHRDFHREVVPGFSKRVLEFGLRCAVIQVLERASRIVLGRYLRRKAERAAASRPCEVILDARRLKLHLNSHKSSVLRVQR